MKQEDLDRHMKVLGVAPGASAEVVQTAWHKAARVHHPDIAGPSSTGLMAAINAAYDALKDGVPARRKTAQAQGTQSAGKASHGASGTAARPNTGPQKNPKPIFLRETILVAPETLREKWRAIARDRLALVGITVEPSVIQRLLRRNPCPPLHVPHSVRILSGAIDIRMEAHVLKPGKNYFALPVFKQKGDSLVVAQEICLMEHTLKVQTKLNLMCSPAFADRVAPKDSGMAVYISTI